MKKILFLGILLTLASCSTTSVMQKGEGYSLRGEWLKALLEYRKAYEINPSDIALRSRLLQTELRAADFYYQEGLKLIKLNNLDGAIIKFQQGLIAKSTHVKLSQAMNNLLARKKADNFYQDALLIKKAGKVKEAQHLFEKVLLSDPGHKLARQEMNKISALEAKSEESRLVLKSKTPITLSFSKTELKTAFKFVAKSFGINVIFDEAVKNTPLTLFARNVTFKQALNLILTTTKTFYRQVGKNTIIIAPDTSDKHGQYEDHMIRVFHLQTVKAKEMANIIKGVISVKKLVINDDLNSILIRDTSPVLALVEKLITINDRTPAEMILDVDILEVNRTKAEQLGFDYGTEVSETFPQYPVSGSLMGAINQGTVTIPAITFRFFKQEVDAKTLANPKIRVMNNKEAKIHIGDRVPLRAATITDSLGQSRTSFEYKDVGIRLTVHPTIHVDNSATVQLSLEVSTLGQNLGTPEEPAFSIGTRNASTFMLLRDGETAILGGLIRDEERNSVISVPGLGDIPIIGSLFRSKDNSSTRTDVLLTITPRIIRGWDLSRPDERNIFSGSEKSFLNNPLFEYLKVNAKGKSLPSINIGGQLDKRSKSKSKANSNDDALDLSDKDGLNNLILGFDKTQYSTNQDSVFTIDLTANHLEGVKNLPIDILFNPQLTQFDDVESNLKSVTSFVVNKDDIEKGLLHIQFTGIEEEGSANLARLRFKAVNSGISYLIYKDKQYTDKNDKHQIPRIKTSRVIIK